MVEEVEATGHKAVPVRADARSEEDVENMVERTIETFGRPDTLINNPVAMWWERVLNRPQSGRRDVADQLMRRLPVHLLRVTTHDRERLGAHRQLQASYIYGHNY